MAYLLVDPRDYGTLGVVLSLITIARVFLSQGMPQATSRFIAQDETSAGTIFRKALRIQSVSAVIVGVCYVGGIPLWTRLLDDESLSTYILWTALLIPLMGILQMHLAYLNGKRRFGQQAFFIGLYSISRFVFALLIVLLGMKVLGVVFGFILAALLALVALRLSVRIEPGVADYDSRPLIYFALPVVLFSIGISLLLNLDILLLKHFYSESPIVGYYNGAMNLGKAPYFVFSAFSMTILPSVAKSLGDKNIDEARALIGKNLSWLLFLGIPSATIVFATSGKLLDFIYPAEYVAASGPLSILVFSMTGLALLASLTAILNAKGHPVASMAIVLLCIPVQVGLALYLIPKHGMSGAAYSNLISVSLGVLVAGALVRKYFGTLFDIKLVAKALLASFVVYCLLRHFSSYPLMALPFVYAVSFFVFFIITLAVSKITGTSLALTEKMVSK
jgi:O-antigen/teichoic acid export membrane protein